MTARSQVGLALHGIAGSAFRSVLIVVCALIVAGFVLATALLAQAAQDSLTRSLDRLGADLVVVIESARTDAKDALIMGTPTAARMPGVFTSWVARVKGVEAVSAQLYLGAIATSPYIDEGDLLVVAYDPRTDFTLGPWVKSGAAGDLAMGQAVAGSAVSVPPGRTLELYGVPLSVRATLEPTGTDLDHSLFVGFETAYELARASKAAADGTLAAPRGEVSAVMVKVAPGARPRRVAAAIRGEVTGAAAVASPDMFKDYRSQMAGLRRGLVVIMVLAVVLSMAVLGLAFSLAAHQRRRQIGVLRALGATRGAVVRAFLTEAEILALSGGVLGVVVAAAGIALFSAPLGDTLGFPFSFPSSGKLAILIVVGLAVALAVVAVAALIPALRVARQEPATSMRE